MNLKLRCVGCFIMLCCMYGCDRQTEADHIKTELRREQLRELQRKQP